MKAKIISILLFIIIVFAAKAYSKQYEFAYSELFYKQEGALNFLAINKEILSLIDSTKQFLPQNSLFRFSRQLLNFELIDLTSVINHEYFGHGSVVRELGGIADYRIVFKGFYWGGQTNSSGINYTQDNNIFMLASGSETNQVLGFESQKKLYLKDKLSSSDFFLIMPKLDFAAYLYMTEDPNQNINKFKSSDSDPSRIIVNLCQKYYGTTYSDKNLLDSYNQMKLFSYYSLLDPCVIWGISSSFSYIISNQDEFSLPWLTISKYKILPGTRLIYNPSGPDAYLDFYIKPISTQTEPILSVIYLRTGEFASDNTYGVGIEVSNIRKIVDKVAIDFWRQKDGYGLNLEMKNILQANDTFSTFINTYYKTKGYLFGKPYEEGIRSYLGLQMNI